MLEGESSPEVTVDSGVPQGTVLGPLLFLCHINDLPLAVDSTVRLFADDCLLYRDIKSFDDHVKLQSDLDKLEQWSVKWGMRFNAKKCYILSIRQSSSFFYQLDNSILKQVPHNPYLGLQIQEVIGQVGPMPTRPGFLSQVGPGVMVKSTRGPSQLGPTFTC